jgi:NAD(P)-dependent dehydrogenase (short-subunit alcohol dehydrogenase family)
LAIPYIRAGGRGGAIVITSSTAGIYGGMADGNPGVMGYIASKHGVVGLMRAWANALAPERIRVNTVHPTGCQLANDHERRLRALSRSSPPSRQTCKIHFPSRTD